MAPDPLTTAEIASKLGDLVLRAIAWAGSIRRRDREEPEAALLLQANWRELDPVTHSGATWRIQLPRWGTLLGQEHQQEPALVEQVRKHMTVAGPFCPRCATELAPRDLRLPVLGRRWKCENCGYSTRLKKPLRETAAAVERLVRGKYEREQLARGRAV